MEFFVYYLVMLRYITKVRSKILCTKSLLFLYYKSDVFRSDNYFKGLTEMSLILMFRDRMPLSVRSLGTKKNQTFLPRD